MIITHTVNIQGQSRVYLGGTGSLIAWIEPLPDATQWVFRCKEGLYANPLDDQAMRSWASYLLMEVARLLDVAPDDLAGVPYETITSLHNGNPAENSRMPSPRNRTFDTAFMATAPGITRPSSDFQACDYRHERRR